MAKPQYSGPWQRVRRQVLERDGHRCQIRGRSCTAVATEVDHIVPTSRGGAWFDPINLRASCSKCNNARVDRSRKEAWRDATTRIVLVVGPPGTPKIRWVEANKGSDDLVVDYDTLSDALALGGGTAHSEAIHQATSAARNAVIDSLRRGRIGAGRAWIVSSNPKAEMLFPYHDVVEIDPGREAANSHARSAHDPARMAALVRDWYETRSGEKRSEPSRQW